MEPKNCTIMRMTPTNGITWPKPTSKELIYFRSFQQRAPMVAVYTTKWSIEGADKKDDKLTFNMTLSEYVIKKNGVPGK